MSSRIRRVAAVAVLSAAAALTASAQRFGPQAKPAIRVPGRVDNKLRTELTGTRPALVNTATIGNRLAASEPMQHLKLLLTSSPEQKAALMQLMAEQQDKTSDNYHKWLTPEQFGEHFGVSDSDLTKVTDWLSSQGLTVEGTTKSRRLVTFSGTVSQVEAAFQTEMHAITVNGEAHRSNTTAISVPEALAPVIAGIARLNDIQPSHSPVNKTVVEFQGAPAAGVATPQGALNSPFYGAATGTHYVTPGDAATIYNTAPLVAAGIDGTGQSISIIAQTNINVADVQKFRSMFGLPKNDPTIVYADQDPGLNGDDGEAYLDAEWGGALAPNAKVNFIVSSPNYFYGGVDTATLYAVEHNLGDVISLSYGGCEYLNGATYTAFWNSLWEQAAAQGQTALVSSGDSGAAGCASSSATYATQQGTSYGYYSVNSLGSSAYNVAVGGSIFVDWNPAQYWNATGGTTVPFSNALSYIPEAALDQSRLATTYLNTASSAYQTGTGVFAAGGGISIYTPRPAWQTGSGIPTNSDTINLYSNSYNSTTGMPPSYNSDGTHRLVPDLVNISANGHDGTLYCASSLCSTTASGGLNNAGIVGGTSVATPVQAGIQALINQKNGGRQGNVLPTYYRLAAQDYGNGSSTACQATLGTTTTSTPALPASTCNFHDVVGGSITVPATSSGTSGIGFVAQAGFDEASGLGSVNAYNVANNFSTVNLAATSVTFTLSPTILAHGANQNLTVNVTAASGTPTGDISLVAENTNSNGPRIYPLTGGSYSGAVQTTVSIDGYGDSVNSALPAGSYNVHIHYGGDANYAPADSASVAVTISKEDSNTSTTSYSVSNSSGVPYSQATTFAYAGPAIYLQTTIAGNSAAGVPTGTVTYSITRNGTPIAPLTVNVDATGSTYFYSGFSYPTYYLKANYPQLTPGTYVVTASYSGDSTFNASTSTTTLTVTQATPTITFSAPTSITSGTSTILGVSIAYPSSATAPNTTAAYATGTVNFTDVSSATTLGSCTLANGTCNITTTAITLSGANTLSATYSGDTNYSAGSATATTTVGANTSSTLTLTGTATTSATVGYVYTLKATMNPTAVTGTVSFYDGTQLLGTATLSSGVASLALGVSPTGTVGTGGILTAGTHNFTAVYNGSTTYSSTTGAFSVTIAKSTTTIAASAPANSTYGQPVVVSVYISRSSNSYAPPTIPLTGTISVTDSVTGAIVGTGTPVYDAGGYHYYVAQANITTLTGGNHTLTVSYSGDANFSASTSSLTPTVTIAPLAPAITLSANSPNYQQGANVYLTITVPAPAGLATPTGSLVVTDTTINANYTPSTLTYNATAGAYTANLNLAGLSGQHTYTVTLNGDTNYSTVTSAPLIVNVLTNNIWVANGNGTVSGLTSSGAAVTSSAAPGGGTAIAIDSEGKVWSASKTGNNITAFSKTGTVIGNFTGGGTIATPSALTIDGAGVVWIANATTLTGVSSTGTPGAAITSTAFQTGFSTPTSVNVDGSGNLWVTNSGDNSVSEVIGVAAPVTTPQTTAVKNATVAAKP